MQNIINSFNELTVDSKRTFSWSFIRGYVTIEMDIGDRTIQIQMLPIQYIVLNFFQHDEALSFDQLLEYTGMNEDMLKQTLFSLLSGSFKVFVF